MSRAFEDHFSQGARGYSQARPSYPEELFRRAAELAPGRESAWDCATGNGQAALGLARHFDRVEATDASADQIAHAAPAPNVSYSVQPAESTTFAPARFDAVCVAQALHWFDVAKFHAEVKRVLRPRGILLVVGYGWSTVSPEFDAAFGRCVVKPIKAFWPPQNALLWNRYRDLPFPFERLELPEMRIEATWSLAQMLDYVGTWTATRRYVAEVEPGFLARAAVELAAPWGAEERRVVAMPLLAMCGRLPAGNPEL